MLYIHIDKEYEIDDIIKEFRNYYEQKKVKLDNIFNLLIDFREYFNQKKLI